MPVFTLTNGDDNFGGTSDSDQIFALDGNDGVSGFGGDDLVDGGAGHDALRGQEGNDTLLGGADDDFLVGNAGDDVLDGGSGLDRAAFSTGAVAGVTVDLNIQGVAQATGQGSDTLIGIEHVSGTRFSDVLTGDSNSNWIWGGSDGSGITGNDTLSAGGGDDLVEVGAGDHLLDGGSGVDTLDLFGNLTDISPAGVVASLALQGSAQATQQGSMTFGGFENLSGSVHNDILGGDSGANVLAGHLGDDVLQGGGGADLLLGDGAITVDTHGTGGSGPIVTVVDQSVAWGEPGGVDVLEGGTGDDTLNGGAGTDYASYAGASGGVTANLGLGGSSGADGSDQYVSIEGVLGSAHDDLLLGWNAAETMKGGDGSDVVRGFDGADLLDGGEGHDFVRGDLGDDSLSGGGGDDMLYGNAGDDLIDGGAGIDRAAYSSGATGGVTVDLNLAGVAQATGQGMDTLIGVEHVSGTRFSDVLTGDGGDNWIWGGSDGTGVTGNDTLSAGGGDDLVEVGTGDHLLAGGAGNDTLSLYGNASDITAAGVNASLALQGSAQATLQGSMTLTGFENLSGSIHGDTLAGDAAANVLAGVLGSDSLSGGDGGDTLLGDGHITVDTHGTAYSGPIVTLEDAAEAYGEPPGADTLDGGKGDDTLAGAGGADVLTGGKGGDVFVFRAVTDSAPGARDLITDLEKKDVIDLSAIDADVNTAGDQAFVLVGAFTGAAGQAVIDYDKATKTSRLSVDVDGDGLADMVVDIAGKVSGEGGWIL